MGVASNIQIKLPERRVEGRGRVHSAPWSRNGANRISTAFRLNGALKWCMVPRSSRSNVRGGLSSSFEQICDRFNRDTLNYRAEKKSWYVVARKFFLLLLNFSAWPCLGAA